MTVFTPQQRNISLSNHPPRPTQRGHASTVKSN